MADTALAPPPPPAVVKPEPVSRKASKQDVPRRPPAPADADVPPPQVHVRRVLQDGRTGVLLGPRGSILLDGEVYDVPSQNVPHASGIARSNRVVYTAYPDEAKFYVLSQATIKLPMSAPDPDVAVLPCAVGTPFDKQPLPLWVMEISDSHLPRRPAQEAQNLRRERRDRRLDPQRQQAAARGVPRPREARSAPRKGWGYKTELPPDRGPGDHAAQRLRTSRCRSATCCRRGREA